MSECQSLLCSNRGAESCRRCGKWVCGKHYRNTNSYPTPPSAPPAYWCTACIDEVDANVARADAKAKKHIVRHGLLPGCSLMLVGLISLGLGFAASDPGTGVGLGLLLLLAGIIWAFVVAFNA